MTTATLRALREKLYTRTMRECFSPFEEWQAIARLSSRATRMLYLIENHLYLKCRNRLP